jgi:hypothetical protein
LGGKVTRVRREGYRSRSCPRRGGATWSRAGCGGRRGGAAACSGCRASGRRSCGSRSHRSSSRPPCRHSGRRRSRPTSSPRSRLHRQTSPCYEGGVGNLDARERGFEILGTKGGSQREARCIQLRPLEGLCVRLNRSFFVF